MSRRFSVEVQSGTKTHWDEMIAHSNTLLDSPEEYEQIEEFIDVDNLIDYMLVHQFMQTRDGPDDFGHNNMRLLRRNNPPGPWRPYAWDMEYSMIDTTGTRDYSYPFPIYSSTRTTTLTSLGFTVGRIRSATTDRTVTHLVEILTLPESGIQKVVQRTDEETTRTMNSLPLLEALCDPDNQHWEKNFPHVNNPLVLRALHELRKVVSAVIRKHGKPTRIHVELDIITGMVAEVDLLTGRRTVLQYLSKPFHRMRLNALSER